MTEKQLPQVELTSIKTESGHEIEGKKAIWNPETGEVFAIASDKYKLVKHEEVLENIESVLAENTNFGSYKKIVSLDDAGGRMRATFRFEETELSLTDRKREVGDRFNPTIEVFNSYDLSWRHAVTLSIHRLICKNGAVTSDTLMKFKKRHMPDLYLEDVKDALTLGLPQLQQQMVAWEGWSAEQMEKAEVETTVEKLQLNQKETKLLLDEEEISTKLSLDQWLILLDFGESYKEKVEMMTRWIFFNIITQFITHRIDSIVRRVQLEDRVRKVFYK